MIKNALRKYLNNFKGFSREIWILTLVTFINRAGTMVLPFLSKYLKEDLDFSYSQVGWIMVCLQVSAPNFLKNKHFCFSKKNIFEMTKVPKKKYFFVV